MNELEHSYIGAIWRTIVESCDAGCGKASTLLSLHSGCDFESGAVHRTRGTNEAMHGVQEVHDTREEDGGQTEGGWAGGQQNFAEADGRRHKLENGNVPHVLDPEDYRTQENADLRLLLVAAP